MELDKEKQQDNNYDGGYIYNLDELEKKAGNRYLLINILAKRVHQLMGDSGVKDIFLFPATKMEDKTAILKAIEEFRNDELYFKRFKE